MIEIRNLSTGYYKDSSLLQNFNYIFEENKIYGILGESGIGKTTLLRTISGLMKPLSGEVIINGKKVKKVSSDVYMMHQNYTCFDWKNCLENILITKSIKQRISNQDIEDAKEMLKLVSLDGCEQKYPKQLSGGMRQRLALARTLFMKPSILLMDEPLSALDEDTRKRMQNLILDFHKENGCTIIMVTHSSEEANYMCDKLLKL